jgi:hypothetical protein
MYTEDIVLDQSGNWHLFKKPIDSTEEGVLIVNVFLEFACAFISETHTAIDVPVLMSTSQQNDVFRIFNFERKQ